MGENGEVVTRAKIYCPEACVLLGREGTAHWAKSSSEPSTASAMGRRGGGWWWCSLRGANYKVVCGRGDVLTSVLGRIPSDVRIWTSLSGLLSLRLLRL